MATDSAIQEQFGIFAPLGSNSKISISGCEMRSYSGDTPIFLNNIQDVPALPLRALVSRNTYEIFDQGARIRYKVVPHPIEYRGPSIHNVTLLSADQISFDFTESVDRPILVGDLVYWKVFVPGRNDAQASSSLFPGLRVSAINGTNAVCDIISHIDDSYSPTDVDVLVPHFVNATEARGTTNSGSTEITNVANIENFRVGDWIACDDPDLPLHIRIVGISGSTLVCHRAMNRTASVAIFNSRLVDD